VQEREAPELNELLAGVVLEEEKKAIIEEMEGEAVPYHGRFPPPAADGEAVPVDEPAKVTWPGLVRLPLRHVSKGSPKLYAKVAEDIKDVVAIPAHWKLPTPEDKVEPDHYTRFEIEPVEFVMRNNIGYAEGNVIKYVCRYDAKEGLVDLYKARRYLDFLIGREEGVKEFWA
jgi:hypothetical protein